MSIIQQIRERAAWLVFGLIALSLVGFLLMDAFVGKSRIFGNSRSTVVGSVNGEKIEYNDFQKVVAAQEEQYKRSGYPMNEAMQQNVREGVWRQMIEESLLTKDENALGLEVTDKEINDMLVGSNPIQDIKRAFTDPKTGAFDAQAAAARINQMRQLWKAGPKKSGDNREYEAARGFFEESVPQIAKMRLREKYTTLLANSAYVPKWMLEKGNADNSQTASISYVNTPYFTVADSTVKIADNEIADYINTHKDQFHQEESRSIAYVVFDAAPNAADSANLRQQLTDMRADFAKAANVDAFLARMGSEQQYFDGYKGKSQIMVPNKDSIFALAKNEVFGPYLDAGSYVLAKKIDEKMLPDSVRARHILVSFTDLQTHQPKLDDSSAKKKIDSIENLLKGGASWDSVALKLSDDPGSKEKGGDLGYYASGTMVKNFNDFTFEGHKGDKKVVKTEIGYHYTEILDQKNIEPAYKVAYLSKKIEASNETDSRVSGLASQFSGENHSAKAFEEGVQKGNYQKLLAPDITPSEVTIPGLGASRSLVRWIYEGKVGDVSDPFPVGDKYVVAEITEINEEGLMSTAKARGIVEPQLRNKKKAEMIIKKLGTPASLEAAATAGGGGASIQRADSVLFSSPMIPNAGQEPRVIGSAFNKALAGKAASQPIAGNTGVFVIKVENVSATSNANADLQQQRFMQEQGEKSNVMRSLIDGLRKQATIKDDRGKFY
jgi:peptidyl-prolyl cis-trans isomerase D